MNIQEILAAVWVLAAVVFLVYKFIIKRKKHDCDDCGLNQ